MMHKRFASVIFVYFLMITRSETGTIKSDVCLFEVSSSRGEVSMQKCELQKFNRTFLLNSSIRSSHMEASWAVSSNYKDRFLLKSSFLAKGSGFLELKLFSTSRRNILFCGVFHKSKTDTDYNAAINVWLECKENALNLRDKLTFSIDKMGNRKRRSLSETLEVDLPGCMMPQFKHTSLCQKEKEKKIRFHARRVSERRSIRVVLSRSVYTSLFEDKNRARGRRYHVAILEEPPADLWIGPDGGKMLEMQTLQFPQRNVRFRFLETKKTYVVSVWRNGETTRYVKKITLC